VIGLFYYTPEALAAAAAADGDDKLPGFGACCFNELVDSRVYTWHLPCPEIIRAMHKATMQMQMQQLLQDR